jgi:hypothetical protein
MPRFVLLRHEVPEAFSRPSHWDLMFEDGDSLLTWAIEQLPVVGQSLAALQLPPHRLVYLDYEGPVSGNRGTVSRTDRGEFDWQFRTEMEWRVELRGERLRGIMTMLAPSDPHQCWLLTLSADASATRAGD